MYEIKHYVCKFTFCPYNEKEVCIKSKHDVCTARTALEQAIDCYNLDKSKIYIHCPKRGVALAYKKDDYTEENDLIGEAIEI